MLSLFFHRWERRLADVSKDRIVRPFEWGLDWLPPGPTATTPTRSSACQTYVDDVLRDTHTWFTPPPTTDYEVLPRGGRDPRWSDFPAR